MPKGKLNIVNRDTYHLFKPTPMTEYRTNTRIDAVRVNRISHDEKYAKLKKAGLMTDITSSEIYVSGKKPVDGIFSPLYGADTTQDTPVFTCDCHKLTGGTNLGRICPDCGTEVRSIEADLRTTFYIDIAPYHIMSFHGWTALSRVIKNLPDIIKTTKKIDAKGKTKDDGKMTIMDLYDDYDDLYADKTGIPKEIAFMSKIPVYSARLRPLMTYGVNMTILDVNKYYLSIVTLANVLKTAPLIASFRTGKNNNIEIQRTLNQIQTEFNNITDFIIQQVNSKGGVFRKALASGRLDYSSRMVISLGTDLMAHEIDVPYQTMMTLFEEEIANYMSRIKDIPIAKAISIVEENQVHPDDTCVKIINQLLKSKRGVWALINRNPTISESGILYCRIRKIHDDTSDMTMHLPPDILALMAADFDGDQCTLVAVKNPAYHQLFLTMCPTYAFIDRANGRFNRAMDFKKDYAAIISAAWDIDQAYNNYLMNPEEDSYDVLRKLGLDTVSSEEGRELRNNIIRRLMDKDIKNAYKDRYIHKDLDLAD